MTEADAPVAEPALTAAAIEFAAVSKSFPARRGTSSSPAVVDIDLAVGDEEFVSILGPSGCGKSTLLNLTAGLMSPTRGAVRYRGEPVAGVNRAVGYITQSDNLLPWRTVERNVGLALEVRGVRKAARRAAVREHLDLVGLGGFADHYPFQLSGGMRKRAALARTLIGDPETLLLDEPFGALDAQMKLVMQQELIRMWESRRRPVMFVTHDIEEAIALSDRVVVFSASPGRIIHHEPIDFERPRDVHALRGEPAYSEVWNRLWSLIESQISTGAAR